MALRGGIERPNERLRKRPRTQNTRKSRKSALEMDMTDQDPEILQRELVQMYRDYGFMTHEGSDALEEWNCKRTDQGLMPLTVESWLNSTARNGEHPA